MRLGLHLSRTALSLPEHVGAWPGVGASAHLSCGCSMPDTLGYCQHAGPHGLQLLLWGVLCHMQHGRHGLLQNLRAPQDVAATGWHLVRSTGQQLPRHF